MPLYQCSVEGLSGQKKEDAGQGVTLPRTIFNGDEQALSAIDLNPCKANQCVLVKGLYNGFWDAKCSECLNDD